MQVSLYFKVHQKNKMERFNFQYFSLKQHTKYYCLIFIFKQKAHNFTQVWLRGVLFK